MANPFDVSPVNPLQALLMQQHGADAAFQRQMRPLQLQEQIGKIRARDQLSTLLGGGGEAPDLDRLAIGMLAAGDTASAGVLASLTNQKASRALQERQFAFQEQQANKPQYQKDDMGNLVEIRPGAPPRVVYQPDYNQGGVPIPPGTNPKAFLEARSKQLGNIDDKSIMEADKAARAGDVAVQSLTKALDLNESAYSGPFATQRGYIASQFGAKSGEDTELLSNIVTNQALENLRATFGGNPTEGERKILLDVQGAASQAPNVRKQIYENAIAAAKARTQFNQQTAEQMRAGTYLLPENQRRQMQGPQSTQQAVPQAGQGIIGAQAQSLASGLQPIQGAAPAPAAQGQGQQGILAQAQDAIRRGADPRAVAKRLMDNNINPDELGLTWPPDIGEPPSPASIPTRPPASQQVRMRGVGAIVPPQGVQLRTDFGVPLRRPLVD